MKRLMVVMVLALFAGGCLENEAVTAWSMAGSDVDAVDNIVIARGGLRNADGFEAGLEADWIGVHGEGQSLGAYALVETPLVEQLGSQYIGYRTTIGNDFDGGIMYGPMSGTLIPVSENVDTAIEVQWNDFDGTYKDQFPESTDQLRAYAGVRVKF